jgi:hypothetical protein
MSLSEVRERLKICEEKCEYYTRHGHRYRRKFLHRRLAVARCKRDREAEAQILVELLYAEATGSEHQDSASRRRRWRGDRV